MFDYAAEIIVRRIYYSANVLIARAQQAHTTNTYHKHTHTRTEGGFRRINRHALSARKSQDRMKGLKALARGNCSL